MKTSSIALLGSLALLAQETLSQQVSLTGPTSDMAWIEGSNTHLPPSAAPPTGLYGSHESQITITGVTGAITHAASATASGSSAASGTSTGTAAPTPTVPRACNGWPEFCSRKYSNVTFIGAHNSPFVRPGNSASNQELPVKTQLDDGIRWVQAQMHFPANSSVPHFCHTDCDLLDAGPITGWLTDVREWVDDHPNDVVTILLENGNYSDPALYVPFIEQTGILKYAYEPTVFPLTLGDWPTFETLLDNNKRVVLFLDYRANQTAFPWWLDEFSQVWESVFDPTDRSFPCVPQRPPNLDADAAADRLYLFNQNLNAQFDVFGTQLLVPAVSLLNVTNGVDGFGSLGLSANNCIEDWGRPPNVLNVDYYNYGSVQGSVFEVAALVNNVSYVNHCCGTVASGASALHAAHLSWLVGVVTLVALAALG